MSTLSPLGTCQICGLVQPKQGQCRECNGIVKAEHTSDPVPPAGVEPEGYKYRLKGRVNRAWTYAKDKPEQFTDEFDVVPLYSGDIVTRLQAEVERLEEQACISGKNMLDQWNRANALQAELTKLGDDYCKRVDELTKARELLSTHCPNISIGVREFLSNQSAPADKGGDS